MNILGNPKVSIITPVYNAEKFIANTIKSVRNQTFEDFEMILIDDCSQDNSEEIIQKISNIDQRIRYIRLKKNSGAAVARNTGLQAARGEYVAFIDSDDSWKKEKLEKQILFMKKNNAVFTYTAFETISEEGKVLKNKVNVPTKLNYSDLLKNTAIACSTVIINRTAVGNFSMPLVRKGQDTATWLMLLKNNTTYAYGLNEVLSSYRNVKGSISDDKFSALKRTWNTYYHIEKLSFLKALYYFSWYIFNAIKKRL
ncbi:glycosyltransferase family 2 protein [Carnobacterium funditum]|uniref:glycosyltransferase family 2 protein n=1 Tax=Carnobacterium funditum TaxID=2752 RepID=UPI00316AD0B9